MRKRCDSIRAAKGCVVAIALASGVLVTSASGVRGQGPDCVVRAELKYPDGTRVASHVQGRDGTASGQHHHAERGLLGIAMDPTFLACDVSESSATARGEGPARRGERTTSDGVFVFTGGAPADDGTREGTYTIRVTDASGRVFERTLPITMTVDVSKGGGAPQPTGTITFSLFGPNH